MVSPAEAKKVSSTLPIATKLAYGFGAAAYGIKNGGFNFFILLFYGVVLGVDTRLVGFALLIALVFDGISDPVVGYLSDNWRSKWGRRHPFMYAAALPVAVSYFLLWNPPDWSDTGLFLYLTILSIIIRTLITFYETPSSALLPELSRDYDERTSLQSFRILFGWTGGSAMTVLMFGVLLVPTATYSDGRFNLDGYASYGIIASVAMFMAIMVSALGTHGRISHFTPPPPPRKRTPTDIFGDIFQTLSNRSFAALFGSTLFGSIASGVSASLTFTLFSFFWEFSEFQIFIATACVFISAGIGFTLAPLLARQIGKKRAVIGIGLVAFAAAPMPIVLRLLGIMPSNEDPLLFPLILVVNTLDIALIIAFQAISYSMIADLVEESELKTGRRSEGVFYATATFTRKSNEGIGLFIGGLLLSLASFPEGKLPGEVSSEVLFRLGALYAPTLWILWSLMLIAISLYKIDRATHNENLRRLDAQRT